MSSPDNDSSSADDMEKFKESVDQQFLKGDLYTKNPIPKFIEKEPTVNTTISKLPSLRHNVDEENDSLNFFHVSPEFQKHVAKRLSKKLEEELKQWEVTTSEQQTIHKKKKSTGIKLLHSSIHKLKVSKCSDTNIIEHNSKSSKNKVDFDEVALEEQCKLVTISGKDILSKKDVKYWSNRSKAVVFEYRKVKNVLEYKEKRFVPVIY